MPTLGNNIRTTMPAADASKAPHRHRRGRDSLLDRVRLTPGASYALLRTLFGRIEIVAQS
jgi:hypothetical protein